MSRILVTGMSGTGKSSALAELGRRGYRVVDTDDPGWREYREDVEPSDELRRGEWLWVEDRITRLLDADGGRSLFVGGCVRNQSKFYDRFDAVVLLSAPADVILDRVARRTTNNYGKTPLERAMIADDLARVEPLLREGCTHEVDASRPLADIVADLSAIASAPTTTSWAPHFYSAPYHRLIIGPMISRSNVEHVARLARLGLTDAEIDLLVPQLSRILEAVGKLSEVDTSAVGPTAQVIALENVMREDVARPGMNREAALAEAPLREGALLRVPVVLEEGR